MAAFNQFWLKTCTTIKPWYTYKCSTAHSLGNTALEAALGIMHHPVENLPAEEWDVLKEVCVALKPFDLIEKKSMLKNR